jgi:hypothetical protein
MPLDQSFVFDGAWRLLSGQIPFRDFTTPDGIVPIAIQALFFKVFGITWLSYVLQAAVFNGLFCLVTYWLLRTAGGGRLLACFYALASALVFYPPMGTPYPEQHSFFFLLLAVALSFAALESTDRRKQAGYWSATSVAMAFAATSKQIPAALGIPLIALLLVTAAPGTAGRALGWLAAGAIGVAVAAAIVMIAAGVDFHLVKLFGLDVPGEAGRGRLSRLLHRGEYTFGSEVPAAYPGLAVFGRGLWTPKLVLLGSLAGLLVVGRLGLFHRGSTLLRVALIALGLLLIDETFQILTTNERENGMAYLFCSVGLLHVLFLRTSRHLDARGRRGRWLVTAISLVIVAATLRDAWAFDVSVNATRMVNDVSDFRERGQVDDAELPRELRFLRWDVPATYATTPAELGEVVRRLKALDDNFLLIGDTSLLYALADKPSVFPALWFDKNLTLPKSDTAESRAFEQRLIRNMRRYHVGDVVLEGRETWAGSKLSDFPRLAAVVATRACGARSIGMFRLVRLCPML